MQISGPSMLWSQNPQFYQALPFITHDKYYHFHEAILSFFLSLNLSNLTMVHILKHYSYN